MFTDHGCEILPETTVHGGGFPSVSVPHRDICVPLINNSQQISIFIPAKSSTWTENVEGDYIYRTYSGTQHFDRFEKTLLNISDYSRINYVLFNFHSSP